MTETLSKKVDQLFAKSKLDDEGRISLNDNEENVKRFFTENSFAGKSAEEQNVDELFKYLDRQSHVSKEEFIKKLSEQ